MSDVSLPQMVDIHCHLVPGIDDGASCLEESIQMARIAASDGVSTVVATPHQLGNFRRNTGDGIRFAVRKLQRELDHAKVPLQVLAGADVRIEKGMTSKLVSGEVVSLGDHKKHVLLELPHELYFPLQPLLRELSSVSIVGILSHPERNQGLLRERNVLHELVDAGCLMQITASSIIGGMGPECQELAHWMLREGLAHFIATDAHGAKSRRPLLRRAFDEVASLVDDTTAVDLCTVNPGLVAAGEPVPLGRRRVPRKKSWLPWGKVG